MLDYPGPTTSMGVREGRDQFAALLDTAQTQPVVIERHGQPVAVVISPETFQRLHDAWEDLQDLKGMDDFESLPPDHPDRQMIPWEQVEKDLGLGFVSKYTVEISARAERALRQLDSQIELRVRGVIMRLADDPFPPASTALVGSKGGYRLRTGDYRVIYRVDHDRLVVLVIDAGHRREIYR